MNLSRLILIILTTVLISCTGSQTSSKTKETPVPDISPTPEVSAQADVHPMVDFNVSGIRIGTTIEESKRLLGKPKESRKAIRDLCGDEEEMIIVKYPGLKIEFGWWEEKKIWVAQDFEVTSSKWDIGHGVRLGNSIEEIVSRFGKPWNEKYDRSTTSLGYTAAPGNDVGELSFRGGRLTKARWYVNPC